MTLKTVSLDDKYDLGKSLVFLSGIQALVRLMLMQKARDEAAGLNTGGFVSGYRGSPLGSVDQEMWKAKKHLDRNNVVFTPGLNEELAATAAWGTQMVSLDPKAKVDGVFAMRSFCYFSTASTGMCAVFLRRRRRRIRRRHSSCPVQRRP